MDLRLKNLRALVTGASRGLGYAAAALLSQEGAQVVINSRSPESIRKAAESLQAATGNPVFGLPGDAADPQTPELLIRQALEALGGLDILITNTGGPPSGKFESFDDQDWYSAIEKALLAHVRLIRTALPALRQSLSPSVLTITSSSVKQPIPNLVLSNSVRAATVGLTKSLALELAADGIRFNSILPGWTLTQRVQDLMEQRARANGTSIEEETIKQTAEIPLGRIGQPEEFANAAVFLVSPAASYITGVMLSVDGGMVKSIL